jgi:hypothetical protein
MTRSVKMGIPNGVFFISDPKGTDVPEWDGPLRVAATASCIAVACEHEQEGEAELTLGETKEVDPGQFPIFLGTLLTRCRRREQRQEFASGRTDPNRRTE